jgi:hypothetical protein
MGENLFRGPSRVLFICMFGKPTILVANGAVAMELHSGIGFKRLAEEKLLELTPNARDGAYVAEGEPAYIKNIKAADAPGSIEHYEVVWSPTVRDATPAEWHRHTSGQSPWAIHLTNYDDKQMTLVTKV